MPERIPPHQQLVGPGRWPLVGERHAAISDRPWTLTLCGAVEQRQSLELGRVARPFHNVSFRSTSIA